MLFQVLCIEYPLTSNFAAWYAEGAIFAVAIAVALALYGFYTSLAGQRVFGGKLIED